jgi:MAP7 domain-containing protein 1
MSSSPTSTSSSSSSESADIVPEFENPKQVEEQYEKLIEKYNDVMLQLEALEAIDDDIQELREKTLDEYEFQMLAEAYQACGQKTMAEGLRCQAEETREKIQELQETLEDVEIKDHFFDLYKMEIQKETLEIQLKACEKYLEKSKKKNVIASKKETIRPASPRRYPKAASPSRLSNDKAAPVARSCTPPSQKSSKVDAPSKSLLPLPKIDMLPPKKLGKK